MLTLPPSMQRLIKELSKLPSIGEKSATRLAYHLLINDRNLASSLSQAMTQAMAAVKLCSKCYFFSDREICDLCLDDERTSSLLCVVEKPMDVLAIERMGDFEGRYHVLHGLWAPLRGQGLESMRLKELMDRVGENTTEEVILAMGSTVEGDATALYIAKLLSSRGIRSSRLAQGMPKGGELEYTDHLTLSRAFSGRVTVTTE